jgi:surface protein
MTFPLKIVGILKSKAKPFIITITTTSPSQVVDLPLPSGETYDFVVNYGDGGGNKAVTAYNDANASNTYVTPGTYQITMKGKVGGWSVNNAGTLKDVVISVDSAGTVGFENISGMWWGCSNLVSINMLGLDLSLADSSSLSSFARLCTSCTLIECGDWDVSGQQDFSFFAAATDVSTLDVGNWDMSSATNLNSFANGCNLMTSIDVSEWSVGNVSNLQSFIQSCTLLPSIDVSSWDTSSVATTFLMCLNNTNMTTFDTSSWDTDSITNCSRMVDGCGALISNFTDTKWWNRASPIGLFANCFRGAFNVPEYASIPNNWKGL